jgi:hypothetical protein
MSAIYIYICAFQNKAADFQKKNQVLVLKELIGRLGSNKNRTCNYDRIK